MKIEIEKSEYDRLKSREEKLMAYYEWFVDKNHNLATVKDIITENIRLNKENISLKEENNRLKNNAMEDMRVQTKLEDRIKELEQCNLNLQTWLDNKEKVNKSLREELSAYDREYFDEDKKAKNIFMEEDTLQELRDIGEI